MIIDPIKMKKVESKVRRSMRRVEIKLLSPFIPDRTFYVISHERSGTHFLMNTILVNCYIKQGHHTIGEWFGPYDEPERRFEHIDAFNEKWEQAAKEASIIKSHCDRDLFEARYRKAKIVYILRDPRDTMVSWFHYLNSDAFHQYNPQVSDHHSDSVSRFLRKPVSPFLKYGFSLHGRFSNVVERWASHIKGWIDAPDTLVVHYETLYRDYEAVLNKATDFLRLPKRLWTHPVGLHDEPSILPRKGTVGDWRNVLSKDDEALIRQVVEEMNIEWSWE
jgi:hypothetical protein